MKRKILFVVSSHAKLGSTGRKTGYFLAEVTHPWSMLEDGYEIDVVSPKGGKPPVDGMDLNDAINNKYWHDPAWQEKMSKTMKPEDVNPGDYMAIFYAGGHGAMWDFPDNRQLAEIARSIYEKGGLVGAVCHGPAGLVNILLANGHYLVADKKLTCFSNGEEEVNGTAAVVPFLLEKALKGRRCIYEPAPNWSDHVVVDGRLVTGQNPASALRVGKEMRRLLDSM